MRLQPRGVLLRQAVDRQRDADVGVELVDLAVGLDALVRLGHAAHVAEVRLAAVTELRVDAREVDGHAPESKTRPQNLTHSSSCPMPASSARRAPGLIPGGSRSWARYSASFSSWISSCFSASATGSAPKKSWSRPGSRSSVNADDGCDRHASSASRPAR